MTNKTIHTKGSQVICSSREQRKAVIDLLTVGGMKGLKEQENRPGMSLEFTDPETADQALRLFAAGFQVGLLGLGKSTERQDTVLTRGQMSALINLIDSVREEVQAGKMEYLGALFTGLQSERERALIAFLNSHEFVDGVNEFRLPVDEATKRTEPAGRFTYRGMDYTIEELASPFGTLYEPTVQDGEPKVRPIAYAKAKEAHAAAKRYIDDATEEGN